MHTTVEVVGPPWPYLLVGLILLPLSSLISYTEVSYFVTDRIALRRRATRERAARLALKLLRDPEDLALLFLTIVNVINILYAYFMTLGVIAIAHRLPASYRGLAYTLGAVVTVLLVLVFGESLPKALAGVRSEAWVLRSARTVFAVWWLFRPLLRLVRRLTGTHQPASLTREETARRAIALAYLAARVGAIPVDERRLIQGVIELFELNAADVMVPRVDIVGVPQTATVREAAETAIRSGHTRLVVYAENIDQVVGILHAQALLEALIRDEKASERPVRDLVRPPLFVPETIRVYDLLQRFQERRTHMAIVVDEFGGTMGLVTLEDILEEVVGEIQDEYDRAEGRWIQYVSEDGREVVVQARVPIRELNEELDLNLPEPEAYDTLAGLILMHCDRIPEPGTRIQIDGVTLVIESVSRNQIRTVRILRGEETSGEPS